MNQFDYRGKTLCAERVPLPRIAKAVGTPTYVYSSAALERDFRVVAEGFSNQDCLVAYSVKANSNLAVLKLFSKLGSGFDIVSGGELHRVLRAGGDPAKVVFAGVGKTPDEIAFALRTGILLYNVESAEELESLNRIARQMRRRAPFAIRVNPDVDPKTHPYIATGLKTSKFGVPFEEAVRLYARSRRMPALLPLGLDCHIGSQLTDSGPLRAAIKKVAELYRHLNSRGFALAYLDVGGGLGISYQSEKPPSPREYARAISEAVKGTGARLILEPGRALVGNAGVLLTRVLYRKSNGRKSFVVVDAGMNDLIRPSLYDAFHQIQPVTRRDGLQRRVEVVGPVCESSDVLARDRKMSLPRQGDLWAIMSAGAYGMSMASNYNSRPRPAEVLVQGRAFRTIRKREDYDDLLRGEG
jgi:diaminopimelate decarboxylase